jgi:hypothetical protein
MHRWQNVIRISPSSESERLYITITVSDLPRGQRMLVWTVVFRPTPFLFFLSPFPFSQLPVFRLSLTVASLLLRRWLFDLSLPLTMMVTTLLSQSLTVKRPDRGSVLTFDHGSSPSDVDRFSLEQHSSDGDRLSP